MESSREQSLLQVTVCSAANLRKPSIWGSGNFKVSVSISIRKHLRDELMVAVTKPALSSKSSSPSCSWFEKFQISATTSDELVFRLSHYSNSRSSGIVFGEAKIKSIRSVSWNLFGEIDLDVYGLQGSKPRGQLKVNIEWLCIPPAPLPSARLLFLLPPQLPPRWEEVFSNGQSNLAEPTKSKAVNLVRCPQCDSSFEDSINLAYHTKQVHTITGKPRDTETRAFTPSTKPIGLLQCCHCRAYERVDHMDYRIRRNHLIQCPSCSQDIDGPAFPARHEIQSHLDKPKHYIYIKQDHHGGFIKCPECNNRFQSSDNLAWHMKNVHLIIMRRKCPQCHLSFAAHSELAKHLRSHPDGDLNDIRELGSRCYEFICVKCDRGFSCQESLLIHEKEKHGGGHFIVPASRTKGQQLEGPSRDSHSEKMTGINKNDGQQEDPMGRQVSFETSPSFRTKEEQEEHDRALDTQYQKEEEEQTFQEKEREEKYDLYEEAEGANSEYTNAGQLFEVGLIQAGLPADIPRIASPASTISSNSLSDRLSMFFSDRPNANNGYSDEEIAEISRLLNHSVSSWSGVPRTYIILRTIGNLHILDDLLAIGFTDHWFPVTLHTLPQLKSLTPAIRSTIVDNQGLILTKSIDLEKGEAGKHQHFAKGELLPFQTLGILGTGGFGQVDRVRSTISYKEYARKRIRRRNVFGNDPAAAVKAFIGEVEILKRLKHRHIVELIGSYTDPACFGIVMSPVAEMDLATYLSIPGSENYPTLRTYFGCLTAALLYLHDNRIRHKDVKPQNILVDHGNVLLTDFGLSRDSTEVGSTTSGYTNLTARYCAPEVAMHDRRNSSSDIWSLGCVFLEMFVVLKGHNVGWMREYFANHGSGEAHVRTNPGATAEMISELEKVGSPFDNRVIEWVNEMLKVDRNARLTAGMLIASIIGPDKHGQISSAFCGLCCAHGGELSEMEDSMDEELFNGIES